MSTSRPELLRWQFEFTWSLFELHLDQLVPADFRWEPASYCWNVRRNSAGAWVPDFAEVEPDPVPVPTIAWITWHIGWWWTVAMDHARGQVPRDHTEIGWPGDGAPTVEWLRTLCSEWSEILRTLSAHDLDNAATFPWQDDPSKTWAHTGSWVNSELMKNASEIGQLRILRRAREIES